MYRGEKARHFVLHVALCLGAVTTLFPFVWMISTSLKDGFSIFEYPPRLIPDPIMWSNYVDVFEKQNMLGGLLNSLKIAVLNTAGSLLTASMAAYAFAKVDFKFKNVLFLVLLATMMIPGQVTLIPMFIIFKNLGWIDTHLPLTVPAILANAYGVFLLKQFMTSIPDAYADSGRIDGCSQFRIYWNIILPLSVPSLVTLGLFTFMGNWNNFLGPLIYLNSSEKFTIPLIIMSFKNLYYSDWSLLMAASCVALVPIICLYLFAQRYFIAGIMIGGIKG